MKFKAIVEITTAKTGIDLEDEYDRLNFEKRPSKFPCKQITIEVSKEFARNNRALFQSNECAVTIDSEKTSPEDWEDWGSCGSMLAKDRFDENRVQSIIDNQ